MTGNPGESSYMRAAEKAIERLQDDAELLKEEVRKARSDARWRKVQIRILGVVSAGLIVLAAVAGWTINSTHETAVRVQQGAVSACQSGNAGRAGEARIWDQFLTLLVSSPQQKAEVKQLSDFAKNSVPESADPATWREFVKIISGNTAGSTQVHREVLKFEKYIASVEAPRNCRALYGDSALGD